MWETGRLDQYVAGGLLLPVVMVVAWHSVGQQHSGVCLGRLECWSRIRTWIVAAGNKYITMTHLVGSLCF